MPLLADDSLPSLFQEILAGRTRLVAWGAVDMAAIHQWQCPLPLAYYVDTDWRRHGTRHCGLPVRSPSVLEDEDPATTVVVVNHYMAPHFPDLCAFLDRLGPFRYFIPQPIEGGGDHWLRARRLLAERRRFLADGDAAARDREAVLFVECLSLGGAERQLVNLGRGLADRGWGVSLAVTRPEPPEAAHYADSLRASKAGYRLVTLPDAPPPHDLVRYLLDRVEPDVAAILWHFPPHLVPSMLAMYLYLREKRPRLMVCHLDRPNIIGGVAAILAGVPSVLMSGRNVNPTHFPRFYAGQTDGMRHCYDALLGSGGARLSANSAVGKLSYAEWLGLDPSAIPVVPNCVAESEMAMVPQRAAEGIRALLGIPPDAPMILGVFRLSPEKRPELFIDLIARLRATHPELRAVLCGTGPLEAECRARAAGLGIAGAVTFLGAVPHVAAAMRASTLLLHVPEFEGTPNVLLEAQAQGLAPVCTLDEGSREALAPELRRFAHDTHDLDAVANSCRTLLADHGLRAELGARARDYVLARHTVEALVKNTLAAADAAL